MSQTLVQLADGRVFPQFNGETLSWSIGLYHTLAEEKQNYPRARAVIRAMCEHRPMDLERERRELVKVSFDRMFGHNARKLLAVVNEEIAIFIGN
jgi:hypothetical protein